jgi:hypothetical protein
MVKKSILSILLFLMFAVFCGCATRIKTLYDRKADFTQYKTFCWMSGCEFKIAGPAYLNDSLLRENIKKAIISELNQKGITLDSNHPDLLLSFSITVKNEQAIVYHREDETPFFRAFETNAEIVNYLEGTMVIGIVDKKESKVVWEAFASRYMELNPDLSEENITTGIHLVLKKFPPKK